MTSSAMLGVISYFKTGTYKVTRYSEGSWVDSRWVSGPSALTFTDLTIASVDSTANTLTIVSHGLLTGDGPVRLTTSGTPPGPLAIATDYWVILVDDDTIQLAESLDDAMELTPIAINLNNGGSGSHAIVDTANTLTQNLLVFGVDASVQPMTGEASEELPEGVTTNNTRVMYTATELKPPTSPSAADGAGADRVEIGGDIYRVWKVEYFGVISSHYRVTLIAEAL